MSEKQDEVTPTSEEKVENVETPTISKNEEKLFNQDQVNSIVAGRVAKYSDYDILKEKANKIDSFKEENEKLNNKNVKVDETLKNVCDSLMSQIPDEKLSLIPEDMDILQKITYINKNKDNLMEQQTITSPTTPPKVEKERGESGLIMGKYKDEYIASMNADPKEFAKWCKDNPPE